MNVYLVSKTTAYRKHNDDRSFSPEVFSSLDKALKYCFKTGRNFYNSYKAENDKNNFCSLYAKKLRIKDIKEGLKKYGVATITLTHSMKQIRNGEHDAISYGVLTIVKKEVN